MTESSAASMLPESTCAYRILRYTPNLVRDEWVNIGVLVYDPQSGHRRLRLIEEQDEYTRVRRLHPEADEALLRALRDDLEDRFESARSSPGNGSNGGGSSGSSLRELLSKWDDTLANVLQLAPQKGIFSSDLDAELERLYTDHVAVPRKSSRVGAPGSRPRCVPTARRFFAMHAFGTESRNPSAPRNLLSPETPMRIDYSYRRNGTQGFLKTEFAAITDVALTNQNDRDRFVDRTLRDAGIEPVPLDHFAVWVAKLKPMMQ